MSSLVINASNYHQPYLMGSINSRMYPRWVYEKAGFTTRRHILRRDEYYFNNVKYNQAEANRLMERMGWEIRESRLYGQNGLIIHTTDIYRNGRPISH